MQLSVQNVRPATEDDAEFAWRTYAESVQPHIGPYIASKLGRPWNDAGERQRFLSWWTTRNTFIITDGTKDVGWFHFDEFASEISLANYVVEESSRNKGFGTAVLQQLLGEWKRSGKTVLHSVLKEPETIRFFHDNGFKTINEEANTYQLRYDP